MPCWSQSLLILVVIVLGTLNIFNAACGQKGRLTLPDAAPVTTSALGVAVPVAASAPATTSTQQFSR